MRALRKHCQEPWILLYVERWLKAPMQTTDGQILERDRGTPQGGVVSPILSNIYLDRLDQFVTTTLIPTNNRGETRKRNIPTLRPLIT